MPYCRKGILRCQGQHDRLAMECICRIERYRMTTEHSEDGVAYRFDFIAAHTDNLREYYVSVDNGCTCSQLNAGNWKMICGDEQAIVKSLYLIAVDYLQRARVPLNTSNRIRSHEWPAEFRDKPPDIRMVEWPLTSNAEFKARFWALGDY